MAFEGLAETSEAHRGMGEVVVGDRDADALSRPLEEGQGLRVQLVLACVITAPPGDEPEVHDRVGGHPVVPEAPLDHQALLEESLGLREVALVRREHSELVQRGRRPSLVADLLEDGESLAPVPS